MLLAQVGNHMDAIDTNILIRYLIQDDAKQGKAAKNLIEQGESIFLTNIVFIETVWVLKACYEMDRISIYEVLNDVANSGFFVLEKSQIISKALHDYRDGFDFADMLIGYWGQCRGCRTTYTFDQKAGKHSAFNLLLT